MNVLVTGGTGFLGTYVMAALEAAGHAGFAYDAAPPSPEMLAVSPSLASRFRPGQIGDIARLFDVCGGEKIEAIIHAAGMVGLETSLAQPLATYQTNIMGLVHVCEAARQLGMRKLVSISSNAAYHPGAGDRLVETDPPFSVTAGNPAAHYGTSKMAGEAIGMAYATFQASTFSACASRRSTASACAARCTSSRWSRMPCAACRRALRPAGRCGATTPMCWTVATPSCWR
jgi:UDP-glucose 4-epimerase